MVRRMGGGSDAVTCCVLLIGAVAEDPASPSRSSSAHPAIPRNRTITAPLCFVRNLMLVPLPRSGSRSAVPAGTSPQPSAGVPEADFSANDLLEVDSVCDQRLASILVVVRACIVQAPVGVPNLPPQFRQRRHVVGAELFGDETTSAVVHHRSALLEVDALGTAGEVQDEKSGAATAHLVRHPPLGLSSRNEP